MRARAARELSRGGVSALLDDQVLWMAGIAGKGVEEVMILENLLYVRVDVGSTINGVHALRVFRVNLA